MAEVIQLSIKANSMTFKTQVDCYVKLPLFEQPSEVGIMLNSGYRRSDM